MKIFILLICIVYGIRSNAQKDTTKLVYDTVGASFMMYQEDAVSNIKIIKGAVIYKNEESITYVRTEPSGKKEKRIEYLREPEIIKYIIDYKKLGFGNWKIWDKKIDRDSEMQPLRAL